jgi:hypothetical protein
MSSYKTAQHRVLHHGRTFHFVSYEAQPANPRTGAAAFPATWFLMCAGKRWPTIEQAQDEDPDTVVAALTKWLDRNIFATAAATRQGFQ